MNTLTILANKERLKRSMIALPTKPHQDIKNFDFVFWFHPMSQTHWYQCERGRMPKSIHDGVLRHTYSTAELRGDHPTVKAALEHYAKMNGFRVVLVQGDPIDGVRDKMYVFVKQ